MAEKKKQKKQFWLSKSLRIVGTDSVSFDEFWKFKISRLQLLSLLILIFVVFFFLYYLLFSFTFFGNVLPKDVALQNRKELEAAAIRTDSLEQRVVAQGLYINNLQNVILGNISIDSIFSLDAPDAQYDIYEEMDTTSTEAEQALDRSIREQIERSTVSKSPKFNQLFLLDPVEGTISQSFRTNKHRGVDVVTKKDEQIKSIANGIIIHSAYNDLDGHTIIISHENGIISIYKHTDNVLVHEGQTVKTGQVIGMVGNTGIRSSGPHLHFEMWSGLGPLNPMDYLSFGR